MQRAQQQPVGLKYGYLMKCSQKLKNWDNTWFVLGTQELTYFKRGAAVPKTIDLQQAVSIVSADVGDSKRAHSFKIACPGSRPLILAAETSEQADEWIAAIRAVASLYAPPPETNNGPPKLTQDNRNMLDCTLRIVQSTGNLVRAAAQSNVSGVYSKLILDSLSMSALMCGTTGRVVVYKPKVQSGGQRFTQSVTETMALVVKYKHTYQAARKRAGISTSKGKNSNEDPIASVTSPLDSLIEVIERTVLNWMPNTIDPELTKPLDIEESLSEDEIEEMNEKGENSGNSISPYVSPFFIDLSAAAPPCKKNWDLLADECAGLVNYMESLGRGAKTPLKLATPMVIDQARGFLSLSRHMHVENEPSNPNEDFAFLPEDQFSVIKQQIMGSASAIDFQTGSISLVCDSAPPQIIDVISHSHGISSALCRLPIAIRKHKTKTLVTVVENIGSFSFSLARLVTQMMEHENFLRDPVRGRTALRDAAHAVQYIAIHMLSQCAFLIDFDYRVSDILPFTDTAKLLALSVSNVLESIRRQLTNPPTSSSKKAKDSNSNSANTKRKLASELTDAKTGSMVFWFGLVGQKANVLLD